VIVHTSLRSNKIGNCLCMLASDDGVIQLEVIEGLVRVLKVELNHFNAVCESVNGHFGTLSNSNELFFMVLDPMARVQSQRTQMPRQRFLILEVNWAQSSYLHIEELSCIEHGLLLLSCHLIEQVGVIWMIDQVDAAIGMFILAHVSEHSLFYLLGADPGRQRVTHEEDGPVLLLLKIFVLSVGHCNDKSALVNFIGYSCLRIAGQVESIKLIEEGYQVVTFKPVIDRHDSHASLLQELHVGTRHIPG